MHKFDDIFGIFLKTVFMLFLVMLLSLLSLMVYDMYVDMKTDNDYERQRIEKCEKSPSYYFC